MARSRSTSDPFPVVLIDTQEKTPLPLDACVLSTGEKPLTRILTLPIGDYTLESPSGAPPHWLVIERKSKVDLYRSLTAERERLMREIERALEAGIRIDFLIEATMAEIAVPPPRTEVKSTSITRTMLSWSLQYDIHWWTVGPRPLAATWALRLLEWSWRHKPKFNSSTTDADS